MLPKHDSLESLFELIRYFHPPYVYVEGWEGLALKVITSLMNFIPL